MNEQVDVKRIPKDGRNGVPEQPLLDLVIGAGELDPDRAERAEPFQDAAHVRIDRKCRSVERAHHHARGALRADLGQAAEELENLVVTPRTRRLERASAEAIDQCAESQLQALRLPPSEARESDDVLYLVRLGATASSSQVAYRDLSASKAAWYAPSRVRRDRMM